MGDEQQTDAQIPARDYDKALSVLTSDVRFRLHLLLYQRVQSLWLLLSILVCVLLPLLLGSLEWPALGWATLVWASLQPLGAFASSSLRRALDNMLERSVAQVNTFFVDHNLMLGVIHVGGLWSKAKLAIPMVYFDMSQCRVSSAW